MPYTSAFLEVIPAIDLLQGHAVRLYQGDYAQAEQVADDPIQQAEAWAAQGAPRLHVVDLDGAKSGDPVNLPIIERIVRSLAIPVQVGGWDPIPGTGAAVAGAGGGSGDRWHPGRGGS